MILDQKVATAIIVVPDTPHWERSLCELLRYVKIAAKNKEHLRKLGAGMDSREVCRPQRGNKNKGLLGAPDKEGNPQFKSGHIHMEIDQETKQGIHGVIRC